jgi:hypothetical protein
MPEAVLTKARIDASQASLTSPMKKPKVTVLVIVLSLVVAAAVGRICAHKAASDYGRLFKQAFSMVSVSTFADTPKLREFLANPAMTAPMKRMNALSFLGGGYRGRADELQRGMIYLSEQMALPRSQRFSSPPALAHLPLASGDRADSGLAEAAKGLLAAYESQL